MNRLIILLVTFFMFSSSAIAGFDIRKTNPPDQASTLVSFGFSQKDAGAMIANATDSRWYKKFPKGWSSSTNAMLLRMKTAISTNQGVEESLAIVVINMCKARARDPYHCVLYATAVMCAESSCGKPKDIKSTSIFGRQVAAPPTKMDAVKDWLTAYNVKWFTANEGYHYQFCGYPNPSKGYAKYCDNKSTDFQTQFFYSNIPTLLPFSAYCTSEDSSGSKSSCPNGLSNSTAAYFRVR